MTRETNNRRQAGVESIRLGGMKIDDLPIGEAARAAMQLPIAEETERQNKIAAIRARYPDQSVEYIQGRVRECESNIRTFKRQRSLVESQRSEYTSLLALCERRDSEIEKLADDADRENKIVELRERFGPYQVNGLNKQIVQFEESMQRFDDVIERERASISECRELIGECKAREKELARLGA